jgi:predicted dehydrogenase
VRLGLIGCGAAARAYYVPSLRARPGVAAGVVAIDRNLEQARAVAAELGGASVATDFREALDRVDGVVVAVPHTLHHRIALECLRRGVHVLCEKPLAETADEVRSLVEEARRRGVTVSVNNTRRMYPTFRVAHRLLRDGAIGRLTAIRIREGERFGWDSATGFYVDPRAGDKGIVLDLGAHVLDLVCWLAGGAPALEACQDDSFGGPESVATIRARRDGCEIEILLNRLVDLDPRFTLVGEAGAIECHPWEWKTLRVTNRAGRTRAVRVPTRSNTYPELVGELLDNFLGVIAGAETPLIPAAEVLPSIALIEAYYRRRSRMPMPWYEGLEARIGA